MKKIVFVKKRSIKEKNPNKFSGLIIIHLKQNSTQNHNNIEKAKEQFELYEKYKYLNPRYFEIISPLKEAKLKIDSSEIFYNSHFNILTPW